MSCGRRAGQVSLKYVEGSRTCSKRKSNILGGLIEYSCVFILPQIAQITQTNTAELYYFAEKFVWIIGVIGDYLVIV